ncbi:hypothetical protein H6P81_001652 [Aristolochia fimbriata]|uniref:Methyltransferase type 11 domain-containing protein n=1 Tax=Aristolochia fimbriata TaxID=158543 RepID=A0AAV7F902_ARIFI|nr:hypothetical protein H6P81_001652 [Aristolochia fimbriata]
MGSGEEYPKKKQGNNYDLWTILKIFVLLVTTNLLTFFVFTGRTPSLMNLNLSEYTQQYLPSLWDFHSLLQELNTTQLRLATSDARLADLHRQLLSANSLLQTLLSELDRPREMIGGSAAADQDGAIAGNWSGEVKLVLGVHELPLGHSPNIGGDRIYLPVGAACAAAYAEELKQYMGYEVGGVCPTDDAFAQRLMLRGCEPLPRRRCRPKSPAGYVEPAPMPGSLWATPPDTSLNWDAYTCKSYKCLVDRVKTKDYYDCKDCFDLNGRERRRWLSDAGLDYGIDAVLSTKPRGTVRIGLDIGGGSGTFAARMKERNVTIVTSTMNFDGPFNSFIASRGLIPIHLSVSHRLPFFENTLDIVHSMHVLSNWIPDAVLELALYDVYRVLRPGGLFWLDRFFCYGFQLNQTYVPMIERVGFNKLRWNVGRKLDRGAQMNQWYLSALLEKPMT